MLKGNLIKIAVIDDDEDDFFVIADYIKNISGVNLDAFWLNDYDTALAMIKAEAFDIYLVDYRLGNETGLMLLKEAMQLGCEQPIVLLTGKGNREIDIQAMLGGATDYLVKSELNTEKLERCIRYSLERAAVLKELKERENKYRNLFKGAKDAVIITDHALNITEANQAASLLLDCSNEQLLACNLLDFIGNETQKKRIIPFLEAKEDITDMGIELWSYSKEAKPCLFSVSFQKNPDNEWFVHVILHDMTNIKKAELSNLHAQKLAANERLMRTIAHEIRNPLNNISLSIEHYDLEDLEPELRKEMISIIQRNCKRIDQSITELLNLTRTTELNFQSYTLQEIMNESITAIKDRLHLQNIVIEKKYHEHPLPISADKSKLKIAFSNILINAIEAMQETNEEERQLAVGLYGSPSGSIVSIKDNGVGIAEENLSKLFDPFFTLKKNGVGLGLAVTYSILQSHKADIEIKSTPQKGTNFVIHFTRPGANGNGNGSSTQLQ
ncbi:MAG TPA: ATP-binding protein [Chitinophagaceae bacterium]